MAERVGVREIVLRPLADFSRGLPTLSDSASQPRTRFAALCVRLPPLADLAGAMALQMAVDVTFAADRRRGKSLRSVLLESEPLINQSKVVSRPDL